MSGGWFYKIIGFFAAIGALFSIIQHHEIAFLLWLLVGLVATLGDDLTKPGPRV